MWLARRLLGVGFRPDPTLLTQTSLFTNSELLTAVTTAQQSSLKLSVVVITHPVSPYHHRGKERLARMSTGTARSPPIVRRGPRLSKAQNPENARAAEHDVFDDSGAWFGMAECTPHGAYFLVPCELRGVCVAPPFVVATAPNAERLAVSLGAALSRALLCE